MSSTDLLLTLWLIPSAAGPLAGGILQSRSRSGPPGALHWFRVVHPAAFLVALAYALVVSPYTTHCAQPELTIFHCLLSVGVVGMLVATFPARGRWWLIPVHVGTLMLGLWCWVVGMFCILHPI